MRYLDDGGDFTLQLFPIVVIRNDARQSSVRDTALSSSGESSGIVLLPSGVGGFAGCCSYCSRHLAVSHQLANDPITHIFRLEIHETRHNERRSILSARAHTGHICTNASKIEDRAARDTLLGRQAGSVVTAGWIHSDDVHIHHQFPTDRATQQRD